MMKIYFDKNILGDEPWVPFLDPILGSYDTKFRRIGETEYQASEFSKNLDKFDVYYADLLDCDYVVFPKPYCIDFIDELKNLVKLSELYGKKVIVFYHCDIDTPIDIENTIVFRTSLNKNGPKNEYAMPGFSGGDRKIEEIQINQALNDISIGYCGYGGYYNFKTKICYYFIKIVHYIRKYARWFIIFIYKVFFFFKFDYIFQKTNLVKEEKNLHNFFWRIFSLRREGDFYRQEIIDCIRKTPFKFDYIQRKKLTDSKTTGKIRDEYINNILNNTLALCIRGYGNYSYRLYEVMSLGKIPLFIDTDCKLPLEENVGLIDYKSLFCYVPREKRDELEVIIRKYIKSSDIYNIQKRILDTYNKYLSMVGWHLQIIKNLNEKLY